MAVTIDVDSLTIVALESTATRAKTTAGRFEHVLGQHEHKLLGTWPTLSQAIAVAEAFAQDWDGGTPLQLCRCTFSAPSGS